MPERDESGLMATRRAVLAGAAAATAFAPLAQAAEAPVPIIDTHIHLFDPNRPQGAPYKGPQGSSSNTLGAFPDRYRKLMTKHGVVGAIEVEASPWIEDNLWVLQVSATDDIMVGFIGNLQPEKPEFAEYLDRHAKNPLFRGIRYGNLWGYDIIAQSANPVFIEGLKRLAKADLVLDTANPTVPLLQALVRVSDAVPDLRIVIDHLPRMEPKPEEMAAYEAVLVELGKRPQIYTKLSGVIHRVGGKTSLDIADYRARLDHLSEVFGDDRVMFGSDWPNSDGASSVDDVVKIMKAYYAGKPRARVEKYFWRNSVAAYKWVARNPAQRRLV
jgi:predicted TIM-barrel fold metal-dependent hydrolase